MDAELAQLLLNVNQTVNATFTPNVSMSIGFLPQTPPTFSLGQVVNYLPMIFSWIQKATGMTIGASAQSFLTWGIALGISYFLVEKLEKYFLIIVLLFFAIGIFSLVKGI